jgi:hypothetical protein
MTLMNDGDAAFGKRTDDKGNGARGSSGRRPGRCGSIIRRPRGARPLRDTGAAWEPQKISSTYPTTPTSIVLNVAETCSMRCTYCFADHGAYNTGQKMMTREVAYKAVDFLANITKENGERKREEYADKTAVRFD